LKEARASISEPVQVYCCQEDRYLEELVRYIHLNLLRSGIIKDMNDLNRCRWSGHSALVGKVDRKWQDCEYVLSYFGNGRQVRHKRTICGMLKREYLKAEGRNWLVVV
jgi:hypothetical protein